MILGNGYSKVGAELAHGQAQGPKLFGLGPIAGATIPLISLQVGGSKPSDFAVLLVFLHKKHVKRSAFQNKQIEVFGPEKFPGL